MRFKLAGLLSLAVLISSCEGLLFLFLLLTVPGQKPEVINFATDPRILRGVWSGELIEKPSGSDQLIKVPVRLELTATYVNKGQYTVAGTFQRGSETPLNLSGIFHGSATYEFTQPQFSQPRPAWLQAEIKDSNQTICNLSLDFPNKEPGTGIWQYSGTIGNATEPKAWCATSSRLIELSIKRSL